MKIVKNKIIPFKGYLAINLFGVLFVRSDAKRELNEYDINHKTIHTEQMKYMLYIFFYIWYGIEWLIKLFIYLNGHKAYRNISFEREAYENERNLAYPRWREPYAWFKCIKGK